MSKTVSTQKLIPFMQELLSQGKNVSFTVTGGSMIPFLGDSRDEAIVGPVKLPLKRGDIVFYRRRNGDYVMHRIYRIKNGKYYMVGDAQTEIEGPLDEEQIFGIINEVVRKGKKIKNGDPFWNFFKYVWLILRPFRRIILKVWGIFR